MSSIEPFCLNLEQILVMIQYDDDCDRSFQVYQMKLINHFVEIEIDVVVKDVTKHDDLHLLS